MPTRDCLTDEFRHRLVEGVPQMVERLAGDVTAPSCTVRTTAGLVRSSLVLAEGTRRVVEGFHQGAE